MVERNDALIVILAPLYYLVFPNTIQERESSASLFYLCLKKTDSDIFDTALACALAAVSLLFCESFVKINCFSPLAACAFFGE